LPKNASSPSLHVHIEISDGIHSVPESIKYCKIIGNGGEVLLRDNKDYTFDGTLTLGRGSNAFTIQVEDLAGNIQTKRLDVTIR